MTVSPTARFLFNRLQHALLHEAYYLIDQVGARRQQHAGNSTARLSFCCALFSH